MTTSGRAVGEVPPLEEEGDVDQADEHRDLDERPDDRRERRPRVDAEDRDRHGDRQLEVVRRRREGERRRLRVVGPELPPHPERDEEHHDEVDEQRQGDAEHVERQGHDVPALEREHHDDGEEERDERDGADRRDESRLVPLAALGLDEHEPREHPREERDPEVDEDALGNRPDGDSGEVHVAEVDAHERREHLHEEPRIDRIEEHLEDRVEGDEARRILGVALGELVPDDHHRDAAGEPDHDEPDRVLGLVREEREGQAEHEERPDHPVLDEREPEDPRVPEDLGELLVSDLRERRVHHEDEPHRNRNRGRADREPRDAFGDRRGEVPEGDAQEHREENPERQEPVEEREATRRFRMAGLDGLLIVRPTPSRPARRGPASSPRA